MYGLNARRPSMNLETLEDRTLLAGDVMVGMMNGNVFVHGDAEANRISVVADTATGELTIRGLPSDGAETTINGQAAPFIVNDVDANIFARMGRGDDGVAVDGGFGGGLHLATGAGNDRIRMGDRLDTTAGRLVVHSGPGDDEIGIGGVDVAGNMAVSSGRGADNVALGTMNTAGIAGVQVAGNLLVSLQQGDDTLAVRQTSVDGSAAVHAGFGDDNVGLGGLQIGDRLSVRTGPGSDQIRVAGTEATGLRVDAGLGDDQLAIVDSVFANIRASMGHGNDRVSIGGTTVTDTAAFSGGAGRDGIQNLGGNSVGQYRVAGFELVDLEDDQEDIA